MRTAEKAAATIHDIPPFLAQTHMCVALFPGMHGLAATGTGIENSTKMPTLLIPSL